MAEQSNACEQMPDLIPSIVVRDPRETLQWFEKLGFRTVMAMPMPDGSIAHAHVARRNAHIMLGPDTCAQVKLQAGSMWLYVNVDENVDALCERVRQAGVEISQEPTDQFWGDRTVEVTHPDGYKLTLYQHVRDVSMEEMQQAMNDWAAAAVPA